MNPFDLPYGTIVAVFGALFFVSGPITWLLRNGPQLRDSLPMPAWQIVSIGVGAGMATGLIGGLPYILVDQDPGVAAELIDRNWHPTHSPWSVKLWRVVWFSGMIGLALSLLLTAAAMLGFYFSLRDRNRADTVGALFLLLGMLLAVALSAIYVGGHFSAVGKFLAGFVPGRGSDPLESFSFGAGTCRDLKEFFALKPDLVSNNRQCDVGPIRFSNIVLQLGLFLMVWAGALYLSILSRTDRSDSVVRSRLLRRAALYAGAWTVAVGGLIAVAEPWNGTRLARDRQPYLDSEQGSIILAVAVSAICIIVTIWVSLDMRAGIVQRPPSEPREKPA